MKKIMIYTKHSDGIPFLRQSFKINSDVVLFLSVFLCGLMIGCSLYYSLGTENVFAKATANAMEYGVLQNILLRTVLSASSVVYGVIAGTSALGILPLLFLPSAAGAAYAMSASYILAVSAANGFGRFALIVLPGGILYCTALTGFCAESAAVSRQIGSMFFFGRKEEIDTKRYLIKTGLYFAVMTAGAVLDHAADRLFSRLF